MHLDLLELFELRAPCIFSAGCSTLKPGKQRQHRDERCQLDSESRKGERQPSGLDRNSYTLLHLQAQNRQERCSIPRDAWQGLDKIRWQTLQGQLLLKLVRAKYQLRVVPGSLQSRLL